MLRYLLFGLACCAISFLQAQPKGDAVLFTVDNEPVTVSEFTYIYDKTNGDQADYSKESLEDYIDLYSKFKMKVHRARELQIDTATALNNELQGYRQQLANTYLIENEVSKKLASEAYERMQYDVDVSHIFILSLPRYDSTFAYEKAVDLIDQLNRGADFEKLAMEKSEDETTNKSGGHLGYLTALLPKGFYHFERAAYNLEPGQITQKPVRSTNGYHIIRLNAKRPARGEMEVSHILIRTKERSSERAYAIADSLYQALQQGAEFDKIAALHSEDKSNRNKGGKLGRFGINTYAQDFEDAAFSLQKDGEIARPIKTAIGWHIIRRNAKIETPPFAEAYPLLKTKLKQMPRHEQAVQRIIDRIKTDADYTLHESVYNRFLSGIDIGFLSHRWHAPDFENGDQVLFSLNDGTGVSLQQFANFAERDTRIRLSGNQRDPKEAAADILNQMVQQKILDFAKNDLENRYPDFKSLMREYEEGILLFEVTKQKVWDLAAKDSTGLEHFYNRNRNQYQWRPRAIVTNYTLLPEGDEKLKDILAYVKEHKANDVMKYFNSSNKHILMGQEVEWEKGLNKELDRMKFEEASVSQIDRNPSNRVITFSKIEKIIPASLKTLEEARGFVIADYQDELEKAWVAELKDRYKVKVNQAILKQLIKN